MRRWVSSAFVVFLAVTLVVGIIGYATAAPPVAPTTKPSLQAQIKALQAHIKQLEATHPPPELGQQMLGLQLRHDRLWWAGQAGNWNLAYYMVGELGEALQAIEASNGEAPQVQPQKLSVLMPSIMKPAIRDVQDALAKHDKAAFAKAYDRLSGACSACHKVAGVDFLVIQRPRTPLLDNLRYAPEKGD